MRIIDISMEIHADMVVYPGDPAPRFEQLSTLAEGEMNVSLLTMGSHTGTHVDAQLHISDQGRSVADLPLDSLYGPCEVLDLTGAGRVIHAKHLQGQDIDYGSIVLLKTRNSLEQYESFREDYTYLSEDAAQYLVDKGLRTLGIDYLSIEAQEGSGRVHELLVQRMTVFESLYLKDVQPGRYIFCGLPLKLRTDGAPVRAILIEA
ncbi:MAG: cyclase family protein [Desulfocurvibacter africanus]